MAGHESKEREAIKAAYKRRDGTIPPSWLAKVSKMEDSQVTAVYLRLKSQNKV